jgi:hypothetical protein
VFGVVLGYVACCFSLLRVQHGIGQIILTASPCRWFPENKTAFRYCFGHLSANRRWATTVHVQLAVSKKTATALPFKLLSAGRRENESRVCKIIMPTHFLTEVFTAK